MVTFHKRRYMKIDVNQLAYEIQHMNRHKKIYRVLREELTKLDHWKQARRGDPTKGYNSRKSNGGF
jgi:protein associated with RNAse G/E